MENRRLGHKNVDPTYEDAGLFQTATCHVQATLIPVMRKNNRGDLIINGILNDGKEIAVTFAGRRAREAAAVVARLNALRDQQTTFSNVRKSQLPIHIEGTWRPHFSTDEDGFATRTYHLIAAKWSLVSTNGKSAQYGQPPAHSKATTI